MPKKSPKKAGPIRFRPWAQEEIILLRKHFASTTNRELAKMLGRSEKSLIYKSAELGLKKSEAHRSAQSQKTALASGLSAEHMAKIGRKGGRAGGPARAESLSGNARRKIAVNAIRARWKRAKSSQK